jgi:proteasome accessory factor C
VSDRTLARLRRLLLLIPAAAREAGRGRGLTFERARRLTGARSEQELRDDLAAIDELYDAPELADQPVGIDVANGEIHVMYAPGLEQLLALSLPEGATLLAALKPFEAQAGAAVRGAARKLRRAIPEPLRSEADELVRGVDVAAPPESPFAPELRDAIDRRVEVELDYRAVADGTVEQRAVEPRLVFHRDGQWYLAAWNVAKGEEHLYRLDRIAAVAVGTRTFAAHRGPPVARYARRRLFFESGAERDVTLRLSGAPARLALRRGGGRVTGGPDGAATVVKRMTTGNHLAGVVLGHGGDVTVLAPPDVRADLLARVERLRRLYEG